MTLLSEQLTFLMIFYITLVRELDNIGHDGLPHVSKEISSSIDDKIYKNGDGGVEKEWR